MNERPPDAERCQAMTLAPLWCPDPRCRFRARWRLRRRNYCGMHYRMAQTTEGAATLAARRRRFRGPLEVGG